MATVYPAALYCEVSREDILKKEFSFIKPKIDQKVIQLNELSSGTTFNEIIEEYGAVVDASTRITLMLGGYDDDPKPLWSFPENKSWAWQLMKDMPYIILFLEPQSCLLLGLLCLGGFKSEKYEGYIPDFVTNLGNSDKFLEAIKNSLRKFLENYGTSKPSPPAKIIDETNSLQFLEHYNFVNLAGVYAATQWHSIYQQYNQMKAVEKMPLLNEKHRTKAKKWWQLWKTNLVNNNIGSEETHEVAIEPNNSSSTKDFSDKIKKCLNCESVIDDDLLQCQDCGSDYYIWE